MCNCNRRHKAVTSATLAAARAEMSAQERAMESAGNAIANAGGGYPDAPVAQNVESAAPMKETVKVGTKKS
jgi:hypothetical protein